MGRAHTLCPWQSRAGWHCAHSQSLPGSVACRRAAWRRAAAVQTVCHPQGWQAPGLGGLSWHPGSPQTLPTALPLTAPQVPHHPCTHLPLVGGHSWSRRFGAGGSAHQLPAPSPNPAALHLQPSRTPFSLGRHLCPQPPWQRASSVHGFHPNPTASHHAVSPEVLEPC